MAASKFHHRTEVLSSTAESEAKDLFRQAFAYAEKLQLLMKRVSNPNDVFDTDMSIIRSKIHEKCERVLFISCSKRRKAEELLWRNVFYSVISLCKKYREILDPNHDCHILYTKHLMGCSVYYQQLMQTLQSHYSIEVTKMDSREVEDSVNKHPIVGPSFDYQNCYNDSEYSLGHLLALLDIVFDLDSVTQQGIDSVWLKEACQRCYIYLGDIARYQIDLGYSLDHSVTFYQQAVSLDPSNGWPFNQLAALSESKQHNLEALYYYLRSSSALKPFPGVDKNVTRLFEKNVLILQGLEENQGKIQEPEIRSFNHRLLILKFIHLQQLFYNLSRNKVTTIASTAEVTSLCSSVVSLFESCLESDYQEYSKDCLKPPDQLTNDGDTHKRLDFPLLLKMSALSILPAYYLRLQGSSDTVTACAFALTILSLIIQYAQKRMASSVLASMTKSSRQSTIEDTIESEQTMIQLLSSEDIVGHGSQDGQAPSTNNNTNSGKKATTKESTLPSKKSSEGSSKPRAKRRGAELKAEKRRKALEYMNRRRRQHKRGGDSCSDEDRDSDNSYTSSGSTSGSVSSIEQLGEDIDLSLIESLSDTSSNSGLDEPVIKPVIKKPLDHQLLTEPVPVQPSGTAKGRKNIKLAANFSMLPETSSSVQSTVGNPNTSSTVIPTQGTRSHSTPNSCQPDDNSSTGKPPLTNSSAHLINPEAVLLEQRLNTLTLSTRHQEIVHQACQIASKEDYLCCVKVFGDWLQSFPAVLASCGKMSSATLWSRLADLVNFMPNEVDLRDEGIGIDLDKTRSCSTWTQSCAINEDVALRGFGPLMRVHQDILFQMDHLPELKQGIMRIQCLIKFAHFIVNSKTTNFFSYNESSERFMAMAQIEREKERDKMAAVNLKEETAQLNRSKLMKTMAEQRLKSEVDALTVATAKKKSTLFTPYLLPDAITLCNNLHLVKKLMKSKKFVFIIAKSVIESLDLMKKEKSNYAARDAIKFLEKELGEGNRFIRAQKDSETVNVSKRKPAKQEIDIWLFNCLVDCAIYYNCYSGGASSSATPSVGSGGVSPATPTSGPLLTMLLDKPLVKSLDISDVASIRGTQVDPELVKLLNEAKQGGVEVSTIVRFHQRWQQNQRAMK